jgi:hypothetical protein
MEMSDNEIKIDSHDEQRQSIDRLGKDLKRRNPVLDFFTDFLAGFGALFTIGIVLFIVVPLLLFTLKIGVALAIPIAVLGASIILIALFGKFIKFLIKRWQ